MSAEPDAVPTALSSPFVWFGGKRKVAPQVWRALGDVDNYVEPFAGSMAVLLSRPHPSRRRAETVNDKDGYVANFWRALAADPEGVAFHADWPVNEADLMARHLWLVNDGRLLISQLEADPDFYDVQVAGWWLWGINIWIGGGWCSGDGPWTVIVDEEGRKLPHLGNAGQGVKRKLPHLGNAGRGVNRKLPHLGDAGLSRASALVSQPLYDYMDALANRLRQVRVCCGDWSRVVTKGALTYGSTVGVFLDPPYTETDVDVKGMYRHAEDTLGAQVRQWCLDNGDEPRYRIVLAGYRDEHDEFFPSTWRRVAWKASASYQTASSAGTNRNRYRETLWLSPHCLDPEPSLFDGEAE